MQTVTKVTTSTTKTGSTRYAIETADGDKAANFAPVDVGDVVRIFVNEKGYRDFEIMKKSTVEAPQVAQPATAEPKRSYAEPGSYQKPDPALGRIANALERIATALENKGYVSQEDSFVDDVLGSVQQDMGI